MTPELSSVLIVCTGNVCRSPLAEQLLRLRLDSQRFGVASAGISALIGEPMDEYAAEESRRRGGEPGGFIARALTAGLIASAQLVLTATLAQRDIVARSHPRSLARVFSLSEFVALDSGSIPDAARRRGSVRMTPADDVIDPYGLSPAVHGASADQTDRLTLAVSRILLRA
jgi:protein-tyrosine phosphatase